MYCHSDSKSGLVGRDDFRDSCGFGLTAHLHGEVSHALLQNALASLKCMAHRGAINADGKTGDGCGVLIQKPRQFLAEKCVALNIALDASYAVGCLFMAPSGAAQAQQARFAEAVKTQRGLELAGWREVPTNPACLGAMAKETMPSFWQVFINIKTKERDRALVALYKVKQMMQRHFKEDKHFYICSLSSEVVAYKGIMLSVDFTDFYPDLMDPTMQTAIVVFHQRFATNTAPQWRLAHPYQYIAHNGEVNTIVGNRNWVRARMSKFKNRRLNFLTQDMEPVNMEGSDSMSLDNMLELMLVGGMHILRAVRMVIPPAWQNDDTLDPQVRAFHEYNSLKMEPWDGPAGVVLTDGRYAVCLLDRNGLRPSRWVLSRNNVLTVASETGVTQVAPEDIVDKGRVEPGGIIAIDTRKGRIMRTEAIDTYLSRRRPYKDWLRAHAHRLESTMDSPEYDFEDMDDEKLKAFAKMFSFYEEEREYVLRPLAENNQEAVASMGDDTPMAVLSDQPRPVSDYLRQNFAQVTNPAIDPIRESMVMSLETFMGRESNLFEESEDNAKCIVLASPILSPYKFAELSKERVSIISVCFEERYALRAAIERICRQAAEEVRKGADILVLSDREVQPGRLPIPMPMAAGAVHNYLVKQQLRCDTSIIAQTAMARDPHQFAVLFGVGVTAVYPYFVYALLEDSVKRNLIFASRQTVHKNYRRGIEKGLLKILSKMGISTLASYRGAQLFEAIGLQREITDLCFPGIHSRIGGAGFVHFDAELRSNAKNAWIKRKPIRAGGQIKYVHGGEYHAFHPELVDNLRQLVRTNSAEHYARHQQLVNKRAPAHLRDLLGLTQDRKSIPIEEVEPRKEILRRFDTAAMSLGALSPEAHETLAEAMSRLGGRSNSGEGGEDAARFNTVKNSKIKQVASGRFGVTPHYLVNAEVLQIKIAQGAKPGEGGQLPGGKVNRLIARLRYSSPGVTLISPPPHHDIYSIEDLAQLIYDLKEVNQRALVSVKLVSSVGVGIIAAGVAKCGADLITISGYDGGTAASPLGSIRYAGTPWELGLSETHQALQVNGFRDRVRVQTDGGLKSGMDVIKAAILGAESFGFGTAPMVAMGCKYLRLCHLNNCPTGVATQDARLRSEHFTGQVDMVVNFFNFIAEEVRQILARLGYRSLREIIGHKQLLRVRQDALQTRAKLKGLDLSPLLAEPQPGAARYCTVKRNPVVRSGDLAQRILQDLRPDIEAGRRGEGHYAITNRDRTIGGALSGHIARKYGPTGLERNPIHLSFEGTAGQSFAAWNINGVNLSLVGFANDYVGKGMAGGKVMIIPPCQTENALPLAGNTCLYGATGGKVFIAGTVGQRFAVRNSGTIAIVEGAGDHCCEYMTGGVVTVLGPTGKNFGAGMTGGFAYVWDADRSFIDKYNEELIEIDRIVNEETEVYRNHLRHLLEEFVQSTNSPRAQRVLANFDDHINRFWLVKPKAAGIDNLMQNLQNRAA